MKWRNHTMKIKEITGYIENLAPPVLQESYDNSGLIIGNPETEVSAALVTLDITEPVIDEAIRRGAELIISHHPVIFTPLKRLTGKNYIERAVISAIKNDIAIYAAHTNLDVIKGGVNTKIGQKLNLQNRRVLQPVKNRLKKLVTFIPSEASTKVQEAIFNAGAGHTGNYDYCGYSLEGAGTFRGNDQSNPYKGQKGKIHTEKEIRFETIFPSWLENRILQALINAHPYEEPAFDIYALDNCLETTGMGLTGNLPEPLPEKEFLESLKKTFNAYCIKHTKFTGKPIQKVAVCGGSGSDLLSSAIAVNADVFVSADFKYHQFFDADGKILIADIGHFESEQFTKELLLELLIKKFPKFAFHFSEVFTNPVSYF
jgi:dinuclear metal center YbgI/SA1388 family protein